MKEKNTEENKLIIFNNNIFFKIKKFFMNLFNKNKVIETSQEKVEIEESNCNSKINTFINEINVELKKPNLKLLMMKNDLLTGKIEEEDLCESELNQLRQFLLEEIEQKNISINNYKNKILQIKKQIN